MVIEFSDAGDQDRLGGRARRGNRLGNMDDCETSKGEWMPSHHFDHDKLDVYRVAIEYVAESFAIAKELSGMHRHARDQWLRAAQSIPLNIAEGNGKRSTKDRARYFDIARGSALECAAIQDVLVVSHGIGKPVYEGLKAKLKRIVSMLTRLTLAAQDASQERVSSSID